MFKKLLFAFLFCLQIHAEEKVFTWKNIPKNIEYKEEKIGKSFTYYSYGRKEVFLKHVLPMVIKIRNHLKRNQIRSIMEMVDEEEKELTKEFLMKIGYKIGNDEEFYKSWIHFDKKKKFYKIKLGISNWRDFYTYMRFIKNDFIDKNNQKVQLSLEREHDVLKGVEMIRNYLSSAGYTIGTDEEVEATLRDFEITGKVILNRDYFPKYNGSNHVGFHVISDCIESIVNKNATTVVTYSDSNQFSNEMDYNKEYFVHSEGGMGASCFWPKNDIVELTCNYASRFLIKVYYSYRPVLYIYRTNISSDCSTWGH